MKSSTLKNEALCWLRYGKLMDGVCTEGGAWSSDVLGASSTHSIEVEVKVSKADLLAEFRNKKRKHAYYQAAKPRWTPNYFYFIVPPELGKEAVKIVAEKFPQAGVLTTPKHYRPRLGELECLKRPKKLHEAKPSEEMHKAIRRRMGSELCGLHIALDKLKNGEIDQIEQLKKDIIDTITRTMGIEDWENDNLGSGSSDPDFSSDQDSGVRPDEAGSETT